MPPPSKPSLVPRICPAMIVALEVVAEHRMKRARSDSAAVERRDGVPEPERSAPSGRRRR